MKPGYKQTEVGVIPEEWEVRCLLNTVRIANGQVDPKTEPYRSMILVAPDHIEGGTGKLLEKRTAAEQQAISGKYVFQAGDIVYSKIRPYLRKATLAEFDGLCSADMYPLKPASDISAGFILAILLGHRFTKYAESVSVRSGMPKINRAELANFEVAVPPFPEQREIAGALRDADGLLSGLDRLIDKKRDLKQAAMQQLLTGQTRLPGFHGESGIKLGYKRTEVGVIPEDWEASTVGREFEVKLGKMLDAEKNVGIPKPYLGNKAVQWNRIDINGLPTVRLTRTDIERFRLRKGDVLVCEGGEIGRAALWDAPIEECYYQKALHRLRPIRGFDSRLMVSLLRLWADRGLLANYVTQTSIAHLPREKFMQVPMPVPPLPEQTAIAVVLSDMDAELAALERRREKTRSLKQAMMQELLTGKTRLVAAGGSHARTTSP